MTKFLSLLIFFCVISINAQTSWDTKEQSYIGGVYIVGLIDLQTEKISDLTPKGKDVEIIFDPFYDTYKITWSQENGYVEFYLKPDQKVSGGTIYKNVNAKNGTKNVFFIHNYLKTEKRLMLMTVEPFTQNNKNYKIAFIFDDLKPTS
ncbi:hypothetical protein [Flavobacterium macacae]|uniref:Uncharacterized protein n=1 Tax=Flavobacterium macacae TaxID=2488993 RepID=A0A3P3VWS8_9FLAO|nr:hypothetical protein [Flavobacterium macacae]RRJ87150.1 hypothetical protein EG849_15400 [Flavobacterium macacae]